MPSRTYLAKSEKTAGGFKATKDRVTLLFCSNASGDRLLKPLLIHRHLRPRALKGESYDLLPVHWMANQKAWVTTAVFKQWFDEMFIPEVKAYLEEKGLDFHVLLLVDNAPGHTIIDHPNVKVIFLPPNTTSLIQPLDQGIIANFKKLYISRTMQHILEMIENDSKLSVPDAWKAFTIKECVGYIGAAVADIKPSTLNACWRSIWPERVKKRPRAEETDDVSEIILLAHAIGGEGFNDMNSDDVEELTLEAALGDEDLLDMTQHSEQEKNCDDVQEMSAEKLEEGLRLAEQLANHFIANDIHVERAVSFRNDLTYCMARYKELHKSMKN
ncbi:tigger transposable element-derived protein 1-like [Toxorhynchites rutilus septentrionalis]|uniref:tigger transposable element-derived protein 1-like n=1 Tax=Toxorhynchites rutilus septentrionalis TaxID=329112 RepID=UPI002479FA4C|nr:tigger transposable element-derived protein 1-like [Toxorhynchites rutilus septentrionalis]